MSRGWLGPACALVLLTAGATPAVARTDDPPFEGTVFVDSDIITSADPTAYVGTAPKGRGVSVLYDDRFERDVSRRWYRFDVRFGDGTMTRFRVNPEFRTQARALAQARKYGRALGRMPFVVRAGVRMVVVNRGDGRASADDTGKVYLATGGLRAIERDGELEELLFHEGTHASLDRFIYGDAWTAAQEADPTAISTYGRDAPTTEDVAESLIMWAGARFRRDRMSASDVAKIERAIPNRMALFDGLELDMRPMSG